MSDTKTKTIEVTEQAQKRMSDMEQRVYTIGQHFGTDSVEYVKAAESLAHSLLQVFRLGGTVQAGDSDLNLYCVSFIHYGIEWFANRTPMTNLFGDTVTGIAGEWSVHS